VLSMPGLQGDDSITQELDRLRQKCKDLGDALMAHLRQDHRGK
jgi:hypothetical protein